MVERCVPGLRRRRSPGGIAGNPRDPVPAPPPPYPDQRDGFLRLDGLTTALTTLFIAVAVVAASSIGALANQRRVIDRIRAGRDVRLSEADDADTLVGAVLLIEVLIGVAIFVLIIVWLWRAYGNIVALGAEPTRDGRGFTIGAWFIPIAAWFIPKQLINDTWRAAAPEAPGNPRAGRSCRSLRCAPRGGCCTWPPCSCSHRPSAVPTPTSTMCRVPSTSASSTLSSSWPRPSAALSRSAALRLASTQPWRAT